jgi:hypothetical protein
VPKGSVEDVDLITQRLYHLTHALQPCPWTLERFVLDSGESPVRTFLEGLGGQDRVDALAVAKLLARRATR